MLRLAKGFVYFIAIVAIYITVVAGYRLFDPDALVAVPKGKDSAMVGDWFTERFGQIRKYRFNPDGTGEIWSSGALFRKFQWGTENDAIRVKYRGQSTWQAPKLKFQVDQGQGTVRFRYLDGSGNFPSELRRAAPDSARIQ